MEGKKWLHTLPSVTGHLRGDDTIIKKKKKKQSKAKARKTEREIQLRSRHVESTQR